MPSLCPDGRVFQFSHWQLEVFLQTDSAFNPLGQRNMAWNRNENYTSAQCSNPWEFYLLSGLTVCIDTQICLLSIMINFFLKDKNLHLGAFRVFPTSHPQLYTLHRQVQEGPGNLDQGNVEFLFYWNFFILFIPLQLQECDAIIGIVFT